MKLGGKKTGIDSFVDKLESEGVHVSSGTKSIKETAKVATPAALEWGLTLQPIIGYIILCLYRL